MVGRYAGLSVAVVGVLVVVVPMRVPFAAGVFIMTPVPIGVAYPAARMAIYCFLAVFGLAPTFVSVVVTFDAHAMIAVRVAALVRMSERY
jgi:hypothetical protein